MNSDRIMIKKFKKLFDLYHNYTFPDRSNSAKIYVVRYSSKNLKFDVYRKYSNSVVTTINIKVLDIVHFRKYSNSIARTIGLDKKLR